MQDVLIVYKIRNEKPLRTFVVEPNDEYVDMFMLANDKKLDEYDSYSDDVKEAIDFVLRYVEKCIEENDVLEENVHPPNVRYICTLVA